MGERPALRLDGADAYAAAMTAAPPAGDYVVIRGRQLDLARRVNPCLFDPAYIARLRDEVANAQPFPHLVVHDWFDPLLLELVREEFDLYRASNWKLYFDDLQNVRRSATYQGFGPASEIYFAIVNSGWFVDLLAQISGVEDLLPDPQLYGGGLHETRAGGKFGIHRDFDRHVRHGLDNCMVFMTYLNKDWDPAWGASLELWGGEPPHCMRSIPPELGTSVLLLHGPNSFHGHPLPMTTPDGVTRRSVATYYYHNRDAVPLRVGRVTTVFLTAHRSKRLRYFVRQLLPPVLVDAIKRFIAPR